MDSAYTIKTQIELDIATLKQRFSNGYPAVRARLVTLGYLINMHRGHDLYREGDAVLGLPLRIDREDPFLVKVSGVDYQGFEVAEKIRW